jgi:hypothetical protein
MSVLSSSSASEMPGGGTGTRGGGSRVCCVILNTSTRQHVNTAEVVLCGAIYDVACNSRSLRTYQHLCGLYTRRASADFECRRRCVNRSFKNCKFHSFTMALSQYVSVSLSLLGLVGLTGAGVAVGSGIGLMSLEMANNVESDSTAFAAASPVEKKN